VDEFPDVTFYVLSEPALSAPAPDEVGIWQELAHLRTENLRWRECVQAILREAAGPHGSADALKDAIRARVVELGGQLARGAHNR
jgi:hypothetical protein